MSRIEDSGKNFIKKDGICCPACKNSEPEWVRLLDGEYGCNSCNPDPIKSPNYKVDNYYYPMYDPVGNHYHSMYTRNPENNYHHLIQDNHYHATKDDHHCHCMGGCIKCSSNVSLESNDKIEALKFNIIKLRNELDAAIKHRDHSGMLIENALCGDGFECTDIDGSRFEKYARRIRALIKVNSMTEKSLRYLENQVIKGTLDSDKNLLIKIHTELQGDLSYNKIGKVKKMIEDILEDQFSVIEEES